jgi:hypothetical protein
VKAIKRDRDGSLLRDQLRAPVAAVLRVRRGRLHRDVVGDGHVRVQDARQHKAPLAESFRHQGLAGFPRQRCYGRRSPPLHHFCIRRPRLFPATFRRHLTVPPLLPIQRAPQHENWPATSTLFAIQNNEFKSIPSLRNRTRLRSMNDYRLTPAS